MNFQSGHDCMWPGDELAEDLEHRIELFEIRRYLTYNEERHALEQFVWPLLDLAEGMTHSQIKDKAAELLYTIGWRVHNSIADASRLLTEYLYQNIKQIVLNLSVTVTAPRSNP